MPWAVVCLLASTRASLVPPPPSPSRGATKASCASLSALAWRGLAGADDMEIGVAGDTASSCARWARGAASAARLRNGAPEPSVPGILNVSFAGIEGESLTLELSGKVLASSGSACSSGSEQGSYVLRALGHSELAAQASLRLSLGHTTSAADVDRAAAEICAAVGRLRKLAPDGAAAERFRADATELLVVSQLPPSEVGRERHLRLAGEGRAIRAHRVDAFRWRDAGRPEDLQGVPALLADEDRGTP